MKIEDNFQGARNRRFLSMNQPAKIKVILTFTLAFLLFTLGILLQHTYSFNLTGAAIAGITNGSIGSQSYLNCTVVQGNCSDSPVYANFTRLLGLFNYTNGHAELPNQTGFNYSLCCAATISGITVNYTNMSADNQTYFNFLNLFNYTNAHLAIPNGSTLYHTNGTNITGSSLVNNADPYTTPAFIAVSNAFITCNYYENLYGNCTYENETCLVTVPVNLTANTTNMHAASCNSSVAYDTSVCCSLTPSELKIWIDGNETTNMSQTGKPYLVTVVTTPNTQVEIEELNSNLLFFPMPLSGFLTKASTIGTTDADGNITFVIAPTIYTSSSVTLANYTINVKTSSQSKNITVLTKDTLNFAQKNVAPTSLNDHAKGKIVTMKSIASQLLAWVSTDQQSRYQAVTVYINGTSTSTSTIQTAGINEINITLNDLSSNPVVGYAVVNESKGFLMFNPTYNSELGSRNHTSTSTFVNLSSNLIISPTSYSSAQPYAVAQIMIYNASFDYVATLNFTINSALTPHTGNRAYSDDFVKSKIVNLNNVVNSLFVALS